MKAIIIADDMGEQLQSLAGGAPACMVRLCGRPLAEYVLEQLADCGFNECIVVMDNPKAAAERYPEERFAGISLRFCTGIGCPKQKAGIHAAEEQPVLVMDGRLLCDFSLDELVRAHRKSNADITAAVLGKSGTGVSETSGIESDRNVWNSGIYMISPRAADIMQSEEKPLLGDLIKTFVNGGMKAALWSGSGYWRRIDSLSSYQQAQKDLLDGRIRCRLRGIRDEQGNLIAGHCPPGHYRLTAPVFIGDGVYLGEGAVIGAGSVLDDGCTVASGAAVEAGTLLPHSFVGERACIQSSVVCAGAPVRSGAVLMKGAVAKSFVQTAFSDEASAGTDHNNTVGGEIGMELTPEFAVQAGCALGTILRGRTIGVAVDEFCSSRVLADALIAGVRAAGTNVLDFGCVFQALFQFAVRYNAVPGVRISSGKTGWIQMVESDGQPFDGLLMKNFRSVLSHKEFSYAPWNGFGGHVELSGINMIYRGELLRLALEGLPGMSAQTVSPNKAVEKLMNETLQKLGCNLSGGVLLRISADGTDLEICERYCKMEGERVRAVDRFLQLKTAGGMDSCPPGMHRCALSAQTENTGQKAWTAVERQPMRDGMMTAIRILDYLHRQRLTLPELNGIVPKSDAKSKSLQNERQGGNDSGVRNPKKSVLLLCPAQRAPLHALAEVSGWELAQELYTDSGRCLDSLLDNERRNG
ncbi:MAG: hypothetical protein E7476_04895 [Ruminococcaceae bacterium]|nr:hypothetical protein [Oscillospiraceae bacterium]